MDSLDFMALDPLFWTFPKLFIADILKTTPSNIDRKALADIL